MTTRRIAISITLILAAGLEPAFARALSEQERVGAQRQIEAVYWNHRIWPDANPGLKPPLSTVVSDQTLAMRVDDALRGARALEAIWNRPVRHDEIQAELDRMARESQAPDVLRELFEALGNDPDLIAETLVRPSLVERHLRDLYAWDDGLHAGLRARVAASRTNAGGIDDLRRDGAELHEVTTRRDDESGLDADGWSSYLRSLADALAIPSSGSVDELLASLPVGRLGRVVEDQDGLRVVSVVEKSGSRVKTATAYWPKPSFEGWWSSRRGSYPPVLADDAPYTLSAVTGIGCTDNTWTEIPGPQIPDARSDHTAVWTGSEMIVYGGWDWVTRGDGGRYNPATDTWSQLPGTGMPTARLRHTAVWTGTRMVVWGGYLGSTTALNTGGRFDPIANTWQATTTTGAPTARHDHTAVWTGTEMIVWGGFDETLTQSVNTGSRYNPSTDVWTAVSTGTNVPAARYWHTAVWTGTDMIVWGGTGAASFNTGGRYRPSTNTWLPTSTGANVPAVRNQHVAVWTGTEMIVWAGRADTTGGRYNPASDTWLATTTTGAPNNFSNPSAVWTGTEMIVWGGNGVPAKNTGARYRPDLNTWTPTSTGAGVPAGRYFHSAVWTGTQMIVWGGRNPNDWLRTGGKYDPSTDSWTPTSTGGDAPAPRFNHRAVWTGAEMIVYGGVIQNVAINTGGVYNPATSSWRPTSKTSFPQGNPGPRQGHSLIWTGTEAIVWGNITGSIGAGAGSRYNPSTDVWTLTSTTNAAVGRSDHTAVWTGTDMIVWGGYNGSFLNSGGRYRPSTDTWSATSIGTNVPIARSQHVAAWTGSRMVVWGGAGATGPTNTGGVYDFASDTWTPTTPVNAPVARNFVNGVWTGDRLIVWGGRDTSLNVLPSGAKYDPAGDTWAAIAPAPSGQLQFTDVWTGTHMIPWGGSPGSLNTGWLYEAAADTWTPTSTAPPVPSPRVGHTAVWTGAEMIVWGGLSPTNNYRSDGGRYCPITCPTWFRDVDGDGHGVAIDTRTTCTQPAGYVSTGDDCNDADPTVFARAPELLDLLFAADKITLSWNPGVSATFDVLRGSLAEFPVGSGASETCLAPIVGTPSVQDPTTPPASEGFWYLVRGRNGCGGGPYGYRTGGIEDVGAACP